MVHKQTEERLDPSGNFTGTMQLHNTDDKMNPEMFEMEMVHRILIIALHLFFWTSASTIKERTSFMVCLLFT